MKLKTLPLNLIDPPERVARVVIDDEKLDELAADIAHTGLVNPLIVKQTGERYQVIAGHRRWMACNKAQILRVDCLVRETKDPPAHAIMIHENLYREDMSPAEEAAFYAELLPEFGDDTDKLADACRQTRNYVENRLLLLSGDKDVLQALTEKKIGVSVAQELNRCKKPGEAKYLLGWAIRQGATVENVRTWVNDANRNYELGAGLPVGFQAQPVEVKQTVAEPTCFLCHAAEPTYDLEFHHIHRSCRMVYERNLAEAMKNYGLSPADQPLADAGQGVKS